MLMFVKLPIDELQREQGSWQNTEGSRSRSKWAILPRGDNWGEEDLAARRLCQQENKDSHQEC